MSGSVVTAGATRTLAGAVQIGESITRIGSSTAVNSSSPLGDGIKLPIVNSGTVQQYTVINDTDNPVQLYADGGDEINGVAGATGVPFPARAMAICSLAAPDSWHVIFIGAPGSYSSPSTVTFGGQTYRANYETAHASSASASAFIASQNSDIAGGQWNCSAGPTWDVAALASNVSMRNMAIGCSSSANPIAVYVNAAGVDDLRIQGSRITSNGYGILTNPGATIDGMLITGNSIRSRAEPVELNAPSGAVHQNIATVGNILAATVAAVGHTSGFGYGLAAAQNTVCAGNVLAQSGWEAFHVEDAQFNTVIVGNAAQQVGGDGLQAGQGPGTGDGPLFACNAVRSAASAAGTYGVNMTYNASGSVPGAVTLGNRLQGFPVGILGSSHAGVYTANVLDTCATAAIESNGGGWLHGSNLIRNSATLVKTLQSTALIGAVACDSAPTTLLDTSAHTAGTMGTTIAGDISFQALSASVPGSSGGTTTAVALFALPKLMRGRVIVRATNAANAAGWVYASADLTWDGTTLTVASPLSKANGTFANATPYFANSSGNLAIEMYSSNNGALTFNFDVIFRGEFYN